MTFFCVKYQSLNALKLWMFQRPEIYKVCFIFEGFIVRHSRNAFGSGFTVTTDAAWQNNRVFIERSHFLASKETTASFVIRSVLENELCTKNYCFSGFKVYATSNVQFSHMNACEDKKEELPPFDRQMKNSCCIISWVRFCGTKATLVFRYCYVYVRN